MTPETGATIPSAATLSEKEAAAYLGVSLSTLRRNRAEKRPPAYVKIRNSVRYTRADLDQFLAFCRRGG
jgi:excisionase family DNA binding protein